MDVTPKESYNFYPGPSTIPDGVVQSAIKMLGERHTHGISLIEKSHRSDEFLSILHQCSDIIAKLLRLDECSQKFHSLFLHGGASQDFLRVPLNLLGKDDQAFYINSGFWTKKAEEQAILALKMRGFNEKVIQRVACTEANHFRNIPTLPPDILSNGKYIYLCTNNTIVGTQYHTLPQQKIPLIADATSDLFSIERSPQDLERFGIIFCSAQKNLGTAGVCLVLVRDDIMQTLLERQKKNPLPLMLSYAAAYTNKSLPNTPSVFSIYLLYKMLLWIKEKGGVRALDKENRLKSSLLYQLIDESELLEGHCEKESRSIVNVVFRFSDKYNKAKEWENAFLQRCHQENLFGLKAHKLLGSGIRASMYNSFPRKGTLKLIQILKDFLSSI